MANTITKIQKQTRDYLYEFDQERSLDFVDKFSDLITNIIDMKQIRKIETTDITSLWDKFKNLTEKIDLIHELFILMMLTKKGDKFINYVIGKIEDDEYDEDELMIPFLELENKYFNLFMSPTFPNGFEKITVKFPDRHIQVSIQRGIDLLKQFYRKVPTNMYEEDKEVATPANSSKRPKK
jgi:hypothetical protein